VEKHLAGGIMPLGIELMFSETPVTIETGSGTVNGTLEITKIPLEITANSASKVYDGTTLTNPGYSITGGGLVSGHKLASITITGSQLDVGSSANIASGAVILDGSGIDVTNNYAITYINGTLEVHQQSSGKKDTGSSKPASPQPTQEKVIVIVNDQEYNAGTETRRTENGRTTVTVEVDNQVVADKINEDIKNNPTGTGNSIQVPVADTDVAEELGVSEKDLKEIKVEIEITRMDEAVAAKYYEAAKANGAAQVDPSKITTGIVFNPDGT